MLTENDWLPMGSAVLLKGGRRPVVIAGFMPYDEKSGVYWDYVGFPYPWGAIEGENVYFDRWMVDAVYLIGFLNDDGLSLQNFLIDNEDSFNETRLKALQEAGYVDENGNVIPRDQPAAAAQPADGEDI